ncbi:MAG: hypothetical protein AABZ76_15685 [Pseudomonadota bacterium]
MNLPSSLASSRREPHGSMSSWLAAARSHADSWLMAMAVLGITGTLAALTLRSLQHLLVRMGKLQPATAQLKHGGNGLLPTSRRA